MEYKVEVSKKILTIANNHDGQVYGGFVRDVIVPRINNPNCDVSFKDVDIWFRDKIAESHFICELVKNFKIEGENESSTWNRELDYSNNEESSNFFRSQYRIYSKNLFLFHIDVVISDKLPVNDFDVNTIKYKHTEKGFEKINGYVCSEYITMKIASMFKDYNPKRVEYYERINRIFFLKGWTVRHFDKHERLSNFIKINKLKITEIYDKGYYNYIPYGLKNDDPILVIDNKLKDETSKLDIADKDILRLIFNNGLNALNQKYYNSIEDKELQIIYKLGLEDYCTKIDDLINHF